jgi:ABC-type branched-subunit amino acid transport system permease subunit
MDNRNIGIIATIITVVLCGIPGLVSLCLAALFVIGGIFFEDNRPDLLIRLSLFCFGLVSIAIPVVLGVVTYRNRVKKPVKTFPDEPIPPPS